MLIDKMTQIDPVHGLAVGFVDGLALRNLATASDLADRAPSYANAPSALVGISDVRAVIAIEKGGSLICITSSCGSL